MPNGTNQNNPQNQQNNPQNQPNNQNELNPEQIKQQLEERSNKYFADVNSLPEKEAALSDYKKEAEKMANELKEKREQLDKTYAEQKQDILSKLDYKNFSNEMLKNGTYSHGTKEGETLYMGHSETLHLLKDSRDAIIKNDKGPTALTDEDIDMLEKSYPDVYGLRNVVYDEFDEAETEAKIEKLENEYLAQKKAAYIKSDEEVLIRNTYMKLKEYEALDQMNLAFADSEEKLSKIKLKQGERQQIVDILKTIEDTLITNKEIGDFYDKNPNTAQQEYDNQKKAFEQHKKDLEQEHKDLIAEYDKHGLDRSHLDGSKEHREKTVESLKEMLAAGEHKELLDKMLEIKNNAAKENSTLFQKAEAKAVDDLISDFVKVDENNTLTRESEELHKNFLMLFGAMDEGKLHTDKVYTDLRSQIRFNKTFVEAATSSGVKGEEFAKTQLETGKRAAKLAAESEETLNDRAGDAEVDSVKLNAFKEKVAKMAEAAGKLITQLDSVPKGKANTKEYDAMYKAIQDVANLDGSKSPQEAIETIERMNKQAADYEKERKSIFGKWGKSKVGNHRLDISKQAQELSTGAISKDITFMSDEFNKNMKVDAQLLEKKGVIDEVKGEKNRRETEKRKAEEKERAAAEKAAKEAKRQEEIKAAKQLNKNISIIRKAHNSYGSRTYDKLSKEPQKGYTFNDGSVLKIEPGEKFTYTTKTATIKGFYDKDLDNVKIYSPDDPKETVDKNEENFRKENRIEKENKVLFRKAAEKQMLTELRLKTIDQVKKDAKEYNKTMGNKYKYKFEIGKDTITYTATGVSIRNEGKEYNADRIKVKAKYDKNGIILDDELKEIKQELDSEFKITTEPNKKQGPSMG